MGYIRKRGKRWTAEVRKAGQSQAKTFSTKAEASAWVLEAEGEIARGGELGASDRTFGDLLEKYQADVTPKKAGAKNENNRINVYLRDPIAKVRLADLSPEHFAELRDRRLSTPSERTGRPVQGASVIRDFKLLSAALHTARREWKWIEASPLADVKRPRDNPARERVPTDDEIEVLRHVAGWPVGAVPMTDTARVVAAFAFCCWTGMRAGETLRIESAWHRPRVLSLPAAATKTREAREVALPTHAEALLEQIVALGHGPAVWGISDESRDALWRKIRDRAGLGPVRDADGKVVAQGLNFHDSRAYFCTWAASPGPDGAPRLDVLALARQLGHKNIQQLMTYYRARTEAIAARLG